MDIETKRKLAIILFLVIGVLVFMQMIPSQKQEPVVVVTDASETPENSISQPKSEMKEIVVHVAGAVKNPGVYVLQEGQRVEDAIQKAMLAEDADADALNRAAVLTDSQKIVVPFAGETHSIEEPIDKSQLENNPSDESIMENNEATQKVNLNQATLTQLMNLPGIGQVKANAIITYRQKQGKFQSVEELLQVNGIGPAIYAQIEQLVFV